MSHQIEYEKKLSVLSTNIAFKDWPASDIKQIIQHTKLQSFSPNTVCFHDAERNVYSGSLG